MLTPPGGVWVFAIFFVTSVLVAWSPQVRDPLGKRG